MVKVLPRIMCDIYLLTQFIYSQHVLGMRRVSVKVRFIHEQTGRGHRF